MKAAWAAMYKRSATAPDWLDREARCSRRHQQRREQHCRDSLCQADPDASPRSDSEGEQGARIAGEVESIRLVPCGGIAVGRADAGQDRLSCSDGLSPDLEVVPGGQGDVLDGRVEAQQFQDGPGWDFRMTGKAFRFIGVPA